jgi:hypothetical protein
MRTLPPPTPLWLGTTGVLPFLFLSVMAWLPTPWLPAVQFALLAYGAVILTFVGALHWGVAMAASDLQQTQRNWLFAWSVVPALVAWTSMLLPYAWGIGVLLIGFWVQYVQDRRLVGRAGLPAWYLPLRLGLTSSVSAALVIAWPAMPT